MMVVIIVSFQFLHLPFKNPLPDSVFTVSEWLLASQWLHMLGQLQASCMEPGLVICFLYAIIHISITFPQIIPPSPSSTESKRLFYTSGSLLLSRIQGYCYHLSEFHIYALVYCIGNPFQYSCLENPMDGGAWWAAVHGVAKSRK